MSFRESLTILLAAHQRTARVTITGVRFDILQPARTKHAARQSRSVHLLTAAHVVRNQRHLGRPQRHLMTPPLRRYAPAGDRAPAARRIVRRLGGRQTHRLHVRAEGNGLRQPQHGHIVAGQRGRIVAKAFVQELATHVDGATRRRRRSGFQPMIADDNDKVGDTVVPAHAMRCRQNVPSVQDGTATEVRVSAAGVHRHGHLPRMVAASRLLRVVDAIGEPIVVGRVVVRAALDLDATALRCRCCRRCCLLGCCCCGNDGRRWTARTLASNGDVFVVLARGVAEIVVPAFGQIGFVAAAMDVAQPNGSTGFGCITGDDYVLWRDGAFS